MPDRMNAAGRVNNPIRMRKPPTSSSTPATVDSGVTGNGEGGRWKNFDTPCAKEPNPATNRNRLNSLDDQEAGIGIGNSILSIAWRDRSTASALRQSALGKRSVAG